MSDQELPDDAAVASLLDRMAEAVQRQSQANLMILMSNEDRRRLMASEMLRAWEAGKIVGSDLIPSGTAYKIDLDSLAYRPKLEFPEPPVQFDAAINRWQYRFFQSMAVPSRYFEDRPRPYRWQRWVFESVQHWGERLAERGLLDNPDIRWEYQKAVFASIGVTIKRLVLKVVGR